MSANSQEAMKTREQVKKEKAEEKPLSKRKQIKVRLIPIWLRLIIIACLIVISVTLGAIVGYSVIGNGKVSEVFQKSTWTHISDLVNKE